MVNISLDGLNKCYVDNGDGTFSLRTDATLEVGDLEIGAVELKNSDTDERASVEAANTARTTATKVLATQNVGADGNPTPSGASTAPIYVKSASEGTDVVTVDATGAAAISSTTAAAAEFKLLKVVCHFSAAPTTSEDYSITLDSAAGAAYDTVLFSTDPSTSSATDIVFEPEGVANLKSGDEIVVAYTNTDTRTYGVSIYYQLI